MALVTQRSKVNLISFLVSLCIVLVAVKLSDGSFATHINKITKKLDKSLSEIMTTSAPIYTNISQNSDKYEYKSSAVYDPRGMHGLYNLTIQFMDVILSKESIKPDDFIRVEDNKIELAPMQDNWQDMLKTYAGLLTIIIILLLFVILMPFCGFCFCCCRCCGKCGSRSQPYDKKHDFCKKFLYATLLIAFGTLLLFCVVCAFASNEQVNEGINDLTDNLRDGVDDIDKYIQATTAELDVLLITNYKEFSDVLTTTIDNAGTEIYEKLSEFAKAVSMTEMVNIFNQSTIIKKRFEELKLDTTKLRNYGSQLNDALRQVKKELLNSFTEDTEACESIPECEDLQTNIGKLSTNIHFNNFLDRYFPTIPDMTEPIAQISKIADNDDLNTAVKEGSDKLNNIELQIEDAVRKSLNEAKEQITQAGKKIIDESSSIKETISKLNKQLTDSGNSGIKEIDKYIKNYAKYWHYVGLAISCLLLLVSLCVVLGLICGICGKRPDVYGDDCCNKGAGSQFLICGVMIMFIFGFLIAIIVLASFLVGTISQRVVCDPLKDPENSEIFKTIDKINFFASSDIKVNITSVLSQCKKNKAIYDVFDLRSQYDVNEIKHYMDQFNITEILHKLDTSGINTNVSLIDEDSKRTLRELSEEVAFDIRFGDFDELINNNNFTSINLDELVGMIQTVIIKLGTQESKFKSDLELSALQLQTYQEKIVTPMLNIANNIISISKSLETEIKFNHSSFQEAITAVLDEIEHTETALSESTTVLTQITKDFGEGVVAQVQGYLDRVTDSVTVGIGKCAPLNQVLTSIVTSSCDNIILRWNGFWFSLFWAILLYIPLIIISVKLATLYQKYNPYSGSLVEAEYLYDAYAERDNIPLNSRNKSKKKKHKRLDDRPIASGAGDMVARDYPGGSHHQDARYSDMAPKQWEDFPAGGPPQYQRAPTEYERPPPYYYPGAGESNP